MFFVAKNVIKIQSQLGCKLSPTFLQILIKYMYAISSPNIQLFISSYLLMIGSSNKQRPGFSFAKNTGVSSSLPTQSSCIYIENVGDNNIHDSTEYCKLTPTFLKDSGITEMQRFLLKSWILEEMNKFKFLRQTYAYASKYIDLYLMKQQKRFPTASFQNLGISCWILATKICGQRIPPINFSNYNQNQIWALEKQLCLVLDFQLHPLTYTNLAGLITNLWDQFIENNKINNVLKFFANTPESVQFYRSFIEILDGLDLIVMSYQFTTQQLVLNTLFIFNHPDTCKQNLPFSKNQINTILDDSEGYLRVFQNFLEFLNIKCLLFRNSNISKEILLLVAPFLEKVDRKKLLINWQMHHISLLRHFQNQNKEICKMARSIIKSGSR